MAKRLSSFEELNKLREAAQSKLAERAQKIEVKVHLGTCGIAGGAKLVQDAFIKEVNSRKLSNVVITEAACIGPCEREPVVTVIHPQKGRVIYANLTPEQVPTIVEKHLIKGEVVKDLLLDLESPTFKLQNIRIMHNQDMDPMSIDEYIARDGYQALAKAITKMQPQEVIDEITKSGLRGRGGAGFPTGTKWGFVRRAVGDLYEPRRAGGQPTFHNRRYGNRGLRHRQRAPWLCICPRRIPLSYSDI
jgi:(2Fe-2S) ferredoxin